MPFYKDIYQIVIIFKQIYLTHIDETLADTTIEGKWTHRSKCDERVAQNYITGVSPSDVVLCYI